MNVPHLAAADLETLFSAANEFLGYMTRSADVDAACFCGAARSRHTQEGRDGTQFRTVSAAQVRRAVWVEAGGNGLKYRRAGEREAGAFAATYLIVGKK